MKSKDCLESDKNQWYFSKMIGKYIHLFKGEKTISMLSSPTIK